MTGTENTIIRIDGDNRPLGINVETGIVDRPNTYYPTPLKGEVAQRLFLGLVGIVHTNEVAGFIKGCNRAAARKQLTTDAARQEVALQYAGIVPVPVAAAGPHPKHCTCARCLAQHVAAGCRKVGCKVCLG